MASSRIRHYWRIGAYVGIVAAMVVGLSSVERHDAHELRDRNRQVCRSLRIVRTNQKLVLQTLDEWASVFSDRTKANLRPVPTDLVDALRRRLATIDTAVICRA